MPILCLQNNDPTYLPGGGSFSHTKIKISAHTYSEQLLIRQRRVSLASPHACSSGLLHKIAAPSERWSNCHTPASVVHSPEHALEDTSSPPRTPTHNTNWGCVYLHPSHPSIFRLPSFCYTPFLVSSCHARPRPRKSSERGRHSQHLPHTHAGGPRLKPLEKDILERLIEI